MATLLFETWANNNAKHSTLKFDNMMAVLAFTKDFIHEHQIWGEWRNNNTNNDILCLKTSGNEKGDYYNLKISNI